MSPLRQKLPIDTAPYANGLALRTPKSRGGIGAARHRNAAEGILYIIENIGWRGSAVRIDFLWNSLRTGNLTEK
jgi:hypothetical protein